MRKRQHGTRKQAQQQQRFPFGFMRKVLLSFSFRCQVTNIICLERGTYQLDSKARDTRHFSRRYWNSPGESWDIFLQFFCCLWNYLFNDLRWLKGNSLWSAFNVRQFLLGRWSLRENSITNNLFRWDVKVALLLGRGKDIQSFNRELSMPQATIDFGKRNVSTARRLFTVAIDFSLNWYLQLSSIRQSCDMCIVVLCLQSIKDFVTWSESRVERKRRMFFTVSRSVWCR